MDFSKILERYQMKMCLVLYSLAPYIVFFEYSIMVFIVKLRLDQIVPRLTALYRMELYCALHICTVQYCTVLYCTVLYCTVLYCIILYCTILYSTGEVTVATNGAQLNESRPIEVTPTLCTVLYCIVLYCTVLYCTVRF